MNWNNPVGMETPARLYIGKVLVATIKKRPAGRLPYYFSQKIILSYNGSFGSLKAAKRHAEQKLRAFCVSAIGTDERDLELQAAKHELKFIKDRLESHSEYIASFAEKVKREADEISTLITPKRTA